MGSIAIIFMFLALFLSVFAIPMLQNRDTFKRISQLMRLLEEVVGLEYHSNPLGRLTQREYADVSGEIDKQPIHLYVEKGEENESELHYLCIETPCDTLNQESFEIYKRNVFAKTARKVLVYDMMDGYEDFVKAKYAFESTSGSFLERFLMDEALCRALLDAYEKVHGTFQLKDARLVYKEPIQEFEKVNIFRIKRLTLLTLQIARRVEAISM